MTKSESNDYKFITTMKKKKNNNNQQVHMHTILNTLLWKL